MFFIYIVLNTAFIVFIVLVLNVFQCMRICVHAHARTLHGMIVRKAQ
jgi:hypothetical protein